MKTIRQLFLIFTAALMPVVPALAQEFGKVQVNQLGQKINIDYSIFGEAIGQKFNVTPYYSTNGGKSFSPMHNVRGNYGSNVLGGCNQLIIWDVEAEEADSHERYVFKLQAEGKSVEPVQDDFKDVIFRLLSFHRNKSKQLELLLEITNKGATRDLKLTNGLVTITDFNKRKYDAMSSQLGEVRGPERYSTPTRTIKSGETVRATFVFDYAPVDLQRAMRLDVGVELITDETFGIDLKIGRLQFRDIPVSSYATTGLQVEKSLRFEVFTQPFAYVPKPKVVDNQSPSITVTQPDGVKFADSQATRGRPYGQSTIMIEDKHLRSLATGAQFATANNSIMVKGQVSDASGVFRFAINGTDIDLDATGNFAANVPLQVGRNEIVLYAVDINNNAVEQKFFVQRKSASGKTKKGQTEELDLVFNKASAPKYYALIMGANDYSDPSIADLAKPIDDASKLVSVLLEKYTFDEKNMYFLKNPTREDMINHLDFLSRKLTPSDNLIIFFAGHGFWDEETDFGYWIPTDSKSTSTSNWMANSQIKDYVAAIKSKHTLLIADACFGGSIFRSRKAFAEGSVAPKEAFDAPSRKAMTSGNLTEVPDQSVFLQQLVERLRSNTKDYVTAEEIFASIKGVVMNSSPVTPVYGEIKDAGDEGGDFIFVKK